MIDVEHKGFRKVADALGMDKDRAHRIYKKNVATFEKQRQRMFCQDPEYVALKKAEQEIERKTKRALAIEETLQEIRDLQIQRAWTSIGLEEIFSNSKDMLEFAQHTVEQCKAFILYCSRHKLKSDMTLAELIGSKEDYLKTEDEEGDLQDLSEYIGSRIRLISDGSSKRRGETATGKKSLRIHCQFQVFKLQFKHRKILDQLQ
jgi:sugar-specific transcriptional regulator TrmB